MLAMRFITWMSDEVKLPLHSGDFRLITRRVRDAFAQLPETSRYVRGMIHWLGFRQVGLPYVRLGRRKGESKMNPLYLVGFMFNAVFNFSVKPLRMFSVLGLGILGFTCLLAGVYLVMSFLTDPPRGITTVLMLLLMNLGILSLGIGVLGEYVAKVYAESKRRPLWLVDYTLNKYKIQPHFIAFASFCGFRGNFSQGQGCAVLSLIDCVKRSSAWPTLARRFISHVPFH
jgi:dolichol-phosphate mannosyltransferase